MKYLLIIPLLLLFIACGKQQKPVDNKALQDSVDVFLSDYNDSFRELMTVAAEAEWLLNTKIIDGDSTASKEVEKANKAFADFTGSVDNIEKSRMFLEKKDMLTPLQVKQFEAILYNAGRNPATADSIVTEKIKADAKQTELLYGFDFTIEGKSVTPNKIDEILDKSDNLDERFKAWNSSKEVGKTLKDGLENLRELRNKAVQALDYSDFFAYEVSDYGMTTEQMLALNKQLIEEIWPLYRELHTWARYKLAEMYKQDVPEMLPAHWLPNRWGQDWTSLVEVEGLDLDGVLREKSAEWIVEKGEEFYVSLGFKELPESFYELSSLYPLPPDAGYKKNNHASAWHMDLDKDVRSLMSVEPNTRWWSTTLHELGHIYYFLEYSNPKVPYVLRNGANRAYHEAMGSLIGLAAIQKPFLQEVGLIEGNPETDDIQTLLKEALEFVVFIPWSSGVMTHFEHALYAENIPKNEFNSTWWNMKKRFQGIAPPSERGEEYCDAASKTHINNDAAQYYDYALSYVLLFQFHDYIARYILEEDPHATNYWGNKGIGNFLSKLMKTGATQDWREHMKENLGEELSARPMLDYFMPLMDYLKKENDSREYTLPEKPM